jgi:hypothetical protein
VFWLVPLCPTLQQGMLLLSITFSRQVFPSSSGFGVTRLIRLRREMS